MKKIVTVLIAVLLLMSMIVDRVSAEPVAPDQVFEVFGPYIIALIAIVFIRAYYMGVISTLFPNLDSGTMLPALILGICLFLLVSICNIIAIHRKITSIWQRKE